MQYRLRIQKDGYGAKAGQVIRGNLARGGDGKFTAAGSASAAKPKAKKLGAAELRAQRKAEQDAERAQRKAERDAERAQRKAERDAERAQRKAEQEAERKKKAEEAAKNKKGGGGGGKKDDTAAKAAAQAAKDAQRKAEQRRKERQAARKDKASQAERQQAQAQRQAEAQQRRADTAARQQQAASERQARQQAQAQRQQQAAAQRAARDAERTQRQAASDAARARRDADRKARQAAMDARRAKLDAAREKMQAQLAQRRQAAEARAQAKFGAWQKQQSKAKGAAPAKSTTAPAKSTTAPAPTGPDTGAEPTATTPRSPALRRAATAPLAKHATSTRAFTHSFAIAKVDAAQRIVEGIASSEEPDRQPGLWKGQYFAGDIVDADAIASALPGYLEYGNIREMHQPSAVGVVVSAELRDRQLYLVVKVVDDAAWQKVVEGVYKGFSIGGACDDAEIIKVGGRAYRRITALTLTEISLVDRPANPAARFTLWKGTLMDPNETPAEETEITKVAGDPTKAIGLLQQLRDAAELDGDLAAAQGYSLAIAAALEAAGIADAEVDDEAPIDEAPADEDLAMAEGLDDLPDDEAIVAMASRIGDIAKVGRAVSGANLAHLTAIHNAITKIAGDSLCKMVPETAPIAQAQPAGDIQKAEQLLATIETLQKRLDALESQPVPGGPVLRAADKTLASDPPAPAPVRKSAYTRHDLRRLAQTEPNPTLRAQYAAELAALDS